MFYPLNYGNKRYSGNFSNTYAAANTIQLVEKSSVLRDHVPTFSVDEIGRLLAAAPPELLPALAVVTSSFAESAESAKIGITTWNLVMVPQRFG